MFRKITLDDKIYFERFNYQEYLGSELNFANIYAWKEVDNLTISTLNNIIFIKGSDFFFPPMTENSQEFIKGIKWIEEYCKDNNIPFRVNGITKQMLSYFECLDFDLVHNEDFDEYLYNAEDLITYSGKKFHSKRNLVNQFQKNFQYEFIPYQESFRDEVCNLIDDWTENKSLTYEKKGILSILDDLENVECFCDCLYIDNNLCAFSIGTIHNNSGLVLFEKANTNYIGIYPALVQLFAERHFTGLKIINRQEDMGIDNLQKSKLSYRPIGYEEKYQATYKEDKQLRALYRTSFDDSEAYINYFFDEKEKTFKYNEVKNVISSSLYYRNSEIELNGKTYSSSILFALSTHPFYRNHGYMTSLIKNTLNELKHSNSFVYLHADVNNFYEKFGFVKFGATQTIGKDTGSKTKNIDLLMSIYNEYVKHFDLYTVRDRKFWEDYDREIKIDDGYFSLLNNNQGYLVNDGKEIIEYCDLNNINYSNDYNMIRIINVQNFIDLFGYLPKTNIQIIDELIPENNITLKINEEDVKTITISEFTKNILKNLKTLSLEKY